MHHLIHECNVEKRAAKLQLHSYSSMHVSLTCFFSSLFLMANYQDHHHPVANAKYRNQSNYRLVHTPVQVAPVKMYTHTPESMSKSSVSVGKLRFEPCTLHFRLGGTLTHTFTDGTWMTHFILFYFILFLVQEQ